MTGKKKQLQTQITVNKLLSWVAGPMAVSKASVDQLSSHLEELLQSPIYLMPKSCPQLLCDPRMLIGKVTAHVWASDAEDTLHRGKISSLDNGKFCIYYEGEAGAVFLTTLEVITDALNGDLALSSWSDCTIQLWPWKVDDLGKLVYKQLACCLLWRLPKCILCAFSKWKYTLQVSVSASSMCAMLHSMHGTSNLVDLTSTSWVKVMSKVSVMIQGC